MAAPLLIPTLQGTRVRLEPLAPAHVDDLVAAATEDRSTYEHTTVPADPTAMSRYVEGLRAEWVSGSAVPFAQIATSTQRAVGATRFLTLRFAPAADTPFAVEIGGTWLSSSAQRTGINSEAKLLLLSHAFNTWHVARVDFKTDARNRQSRAALLRLGATFEGVLRHWQPSLVAGEEGQFRDSAMYSVTDAEWPVVRTVLERRLS